MRISDWSSDVCSSDLLIATTAFAFAEPVQKWAKRHRFAMADNMASLIVVAIYGGYFNGGLGIVLLALFACWGMRDLDQMNGLKSAISLLIDRKSKRRNSSH